MLKAPYNISLIMTYSKKCHTQYKCEVNNDQTYLVTWNADPI